MLKFVETPKGISDRQETFARSMRASWNRTEQRYVSWRNGRAELDIFHNGKYWYRSARPNRADKTPRYLNWFGIYTQGGDLKISVEINIPVEFNNKRVSGFFATDAETNIDYLMHSGKIGGGQKGVSQSLFLAWSSQEIVEVYDSLQVVRLATIVAPIWPPIAAPDQLAIYTRTVADFRNAVRAGLATSVEAKEAARSYSDYYEEFSGLKTLRRAAKSMEYLSRHGEIVEAIRVWRERQSGAFRIVKNKFIDLGVIENGDSEDNLSEIYEIKTGCDRQALYAAIGQLIVHSKYESNCKLNLVVPDEDPIPRDIVSALKRLDIRILSFCITKNRIIIR